MNKKLAEMKVRELKELIQNAHLELQKRIKEDNEKQERTCISLLKM